MKPIHIVALISLLLTNAHAVAEKSIPFMPENAIEIKLSELHASAEKENQFWDALLNGKQKLIVIGTTGEKTEDENQKLILHTWEHGAESVSAVFTSLDRLNKAWKKGTPYVELDAKTLLNSIEEQGYGVYINPRYTHSIQLSPSELKRVLMEHSKTTSKPK